MRVTRPPSENCAEYFDILDGRNKKATKLEEKGAGAREIGRALSPPPSAIIHPLCLP